MTTLVHTNEGLKEALPQIKVDDYWTPAISWIFTEGLWRRTYDPGFVNLINNSRMLNGTDITVNHGVVSGLTPVDWTLGSFPTGNGYSYGSATDIEQVSQYRFVSEQSRHYYISRVQVQEGNEYIASAYIDDIAIRNARKVLQVVGETASIQIDVDFPVSRDIETGLVSIMFTARTSGLVQFRLGAGVDNYGDADVTISRPQITRSMNVLDWQPTPIIAPFYGVRLINSYLRPENVITLSNGDYSLDATVKIESDFSKAVMLFGRTDVSGFSGVGFTGTHLNVYRNGMIDRQNELSKPVPTDRLIGLKVIWKKQGNYISDIRFYLNGELIGRISNTLYSGNIDSMFGYETSRTTNITIQSLSTNLGRVYAFNIDEAEGNILWDRNKQIYLTIAGDPLVDFVWIEDSSPPIILSDVFGQTASIGEEVRFFADAIFYNSVQWFKDNAAIPGADTVELKFIAEEDSYGIYYAEFTNEFGKTATSSARLTSPEDNTRTLITEDIRTVVSESENIIITEG